METKEIESIIRSQEILCFTLDNGEECEAIPVQVEEDGTTYLFVDCLAEEMHMNQTDTTEGGYEASFLRGYLNKEVLLHFPEKLRTKMVPINEWGDLLTIPSKAEIFGDSNGEGQWPAMKLRRNRIAFQGLNGDPEWYWLRDPASGSSFAAANDGGHCDCNDASDAWVGVRPAFKISNL